VQAEAGVVASGTVGSPARERRGACKTPRRSCRVRVRRRPPIALVHPRAPARPPRHYQVPQLPASVLASRARGAPRTRSVSAAIPFPCALAAAGNPATDKSSADDTFHEEARGRHESHPSPAREALKPPQATAAAATAQGRGAIGGSRRSSASEPASDAPWRPGCGRGPSIGSCCRLRCASFRGPHPRLLNPRSV